MLVEKRNYIGQKFNYLTVTDQYFDQESRRTMAKVQCDCGESFNHDLSYVVNNVCRQDCGKCCIAKNMKMKDYVGQKFGHLTIIDQWADKKNWAEARCDCGNVVTMKLSKIKGNSLKTCGGCSFNNQKPVVNIGEKYGRLTIIGEHNGDQKRNGRYYDCVCDCGSDFVAAGHSLKAGNTKSCGCLAASLRLDVDINKKIIDRCNDLYQKTDISERNHLGSICFRGHDWRGTGQSLRNEKECLLCFRLRMLVQFERREVRIINTDNGTVNETEIFHLKRKYKECPYCGIKLEKGNMHMDHMRPLSKGGKHVINNILFCCASCNMRKSNLEYGQWIKTLKPRYQKKAKQIAIRNRAYQLHLPLAW